MTSWISASGIPVLLMYRNPTSRSACWRDWRKAGLVSGFRARERSSIGIELKDMVVLERIQIESISIHMRILRYQKERGNVEKDIRHPVAETGILKGVSLS